MIATSALWLCADLAALDARSLQNRCESAIVHAARCGLRAQRIAVWLRSASVVSTREALEIARSMRSLTRAHRSSLVVGERVDLALLCAADAVHVTHRGASARDVERVLAADPSSALSMTASVHDGSEARSLALSCAVLLAAPFADVPSKNAALGVAGLSAIVRAAPARAVVALGGIDGATSVHAVFAAGARGVAVRRALLEADTISALSPVLEALAQHVA